MRMSLRSPETAQRFTDETLANPTAEGCGSRQTNTDKEYEPMNTNTTIPTVGVRDQVDARYLTFDWIDGQGNSDSVTLGLDQLHADPTVHPDIARNVMRCLQHVYLMGCEKGQADIRDAREGGYMLAGTDVENPWPHGSETAMAWYEGREARLRENEAGQRIEALIGRVAAAEQATATVPTVEPFENAVTIYRERSNFNVAHWTPMGEAQWTHEVLAAELRGVIADAYHAGRNEREGEMVGENQRLRDAEANARVVVEQLQNEMDQRVRDMYARIDERDHDFNIVRDALLEEAERRSWCAEYDEYVAGVNARTLHYDLIRRVKNWNVTITVNQSVDYSVVDNAASNFGFPISYDMSNAEAEGVEYYFTLEDMNDDAIASRAEELRRVIYQNVESVHSALVYWEEAE